MRVALIGGVERAEAQLDRVAREFGAELLYHPGHMGGRGAPELRSVVERAELVVVVTDVNSHGAVQVARKEARRLGRPMVLLRRCSPGKLRAVLDGHKPVAA